MFDLLKGTYEMAIGSTVIPAALLGDLSPNYEEGTLEAETQAGKVSTGSGKAATSEFTFTLFLPKENAQKYLGVIWPELYTAPTSVTQKSGNIVFGSNSCGGIAPQKINLHSVCDSTDDNDTFIYAGVPKITFNPTFSVSDVVSVEITIYMQPNSDGDRFRFGTGDVSQPSIYDPTTQTTIPVVISA